MRTWTLAGAFDAGHIRGWTPDWQQELEFHQLELTGHAEQLEADYRLFREEFGLSLFRDGAWLARTYPGPGQFDWSYLDRVAGLSRRRVTLSLCHYEWPSWIDESDLWNGRVIDVMAGFAGQVARREVARTVRDYTAAPSAAVPVCDHAIRGYNRLSHKEGTP